MLLLYFHLLNVRGLETGQEQNSAIEANKDDVK